MYTKKSNMNKICFYFFRMRRKCAVAICTSPQETTSHRFPRDPHLRKLWISACRRGDDLDTQKCVVCTVHFKKEDYQRDFKNELMNKPLRKLLKPDAIPTLCLSTAQKRDNENTERDNRMAKKQRKELVNELLKKVYDLRIREGSEYWTTNFDASCIGIADTKNLTNQIIQTLVVLYYGSHSTLNNTLTRTIQSDTEVRKEEIGFRDLNKVVNKRSHS